MSGHATVSAVIPQQTVAAPPKDANLSDFAILVSQLVLLVAVFRLFLVEEPAFMVLSIVVVAGFCVHYWLPKRRKEWFVIGLSIAASFLLLKPAIAALLIITGLALYCIAAAPLPYRYRVAIIGIAVGALSVMRFAGVPWLPEGFAAIFGSLFVFRLIVYLYDLKHMTIRPSLREYLAYFFILPNYYFLLFPVVDFQTMRRSLFKRNVNVLAQQGIEWMVRGTSHLLLYRIVAEVRPSGDPNHITSAATLVTYMVLTYMLYLRLSGQFHIAIGMMHLFGYDLPETHRRYFLASSITDFWRRINIYWKDFMVKTVYFPVYFQLRKQGDVRAQILATASVFLVTWALHAYQYLWLKGQFLITWPDTLFWSMLGLLVIANLLLETRAKRHKRVVSTSGLQHSLKVVGTFCTLTILWSLWHAPSVHTWLDMLTWWRKGI